MTRPRPPVTHSSLQPNPQAARAYEWPSWILIAVVYGCWFALMLNYQSLPAWAFFSLAFVVTAWFLSLQHELLHGHPTRSKRINRLLGLMPIAVWYPYDLYRDSHLAHHRDEQLTLPGIDPESNYVQPEVYQRSSGLMRAAWTFQRTALGRFVLGPLLAVVHVYSHALTPSNLKKPGQLWTWAQHLTLLVVMLAALWHYCGIFPLTYMLFVAWPALGLAMMRSFYEHRPGDTPTQRIAINEGGLFWQLLYLNNNYHLVHHELPGLPWYECKAVYFANRDDILRRNGGFLVPGYLPMIAKHFVTPVDSPVFPAALRPTPKP